MADGHTKLHSNEHLKGNVDELTGLDATQIADGTVNNTEFEYLDGLSGTIATEDYVDSKVQGIDWQDSVIDKDVSDPSTLTPSDGDRYIVAAGGSGDWSGHDDDIAEYNGSSWEFITPNEGFATWVEDENIQYVWNGSSWVTLSSTSDHGSLTGLGDDDHTQYLLTNGTRSMNGSLDMGTNNITNVGNVDGIDVSAHDHDGDAPNIPNAGLANSSVTVNSGTLLTGGGSVSLGNSITLNVDEGSISHDNISGVSENDHHDAFVGLEDNAGTSVAPAGDNYIQITDDGIVNADAGTNTIDLSVSEGNIDHGNLSGLGGDDHTQYLLVDGSRSMSGNLNMGNYDITNCTDITADGSIDFSSGTLKMPYFSQSTEPDIASDTVAVWQDSDNSQTWLLIDVAGTQYKVEAA